MRYSIPPLQLLFSLYSKGRPPVAPTKASLANQCAAQRNPSIIVENNIINKYATKMLMSNQSKSKGGTEGGSQRVKRSETRWDTRSDRTLRNQGDRRRTV